MANDAVTLTCFFPHSSRALEPFRRVKSIHCTLYLEAAAMAERKARVLYDYKADGDNQVTIKEGDIITIIGHATPENWVLCRNRYTYVLYTHHITIAISNSRFYTYSLHSYSFDYSSSSSNVTHPFLHHICHSAPHYTAHNE